MPAQEFKSVFTADISQYKAELGVLKQTTTGVVGEIRSSLATLAGLSVAGIGVKELVGDISGQGTGACPPCPPCPPSHDGSADSSAGLYLALSFPAPGNAA